MCGLVSQAQDVSHDLWRSCEVMRPAGSLPNTCLSLGDVQSKLKGVIVRIHGLTVHVQKDSGCQPSQTLVAITGCPSRSSPELQTAIDGDG